MRGCIYSLSLTWNPFEKPFSIVAIVYHGAVSMQDKAHCPFHLKTGVCRFGARCSRVHFYPDKACTLLIKNMYSGPGLAWEQDEGLEVCYWTHWVVLVSWCQLNKLSAPFVILLHDYSPFIYVFFAWFWSLLLFFCTILASSVILLHDFQPFRCRLCVIKFAFLAIMNTCWKIIVLTWWQGN